MINVEKAVLDPSSVFNTPEDVLRCNEINKNQKIEILHHWEYDMRELEVAEEENMQGPETDIFDRILRALHKLGDQPCLERSAPTKQGGE